MMLCSRVSTARVRVSQAPRATSSTRPTTLVAVAASHRPPPPQRSRAHRVSSPCHDQRSPSVGSAH